MELSDKQISEFQRIYEKEFGVKISRQDAIDQGTKLLALVKIVYQPIPKQDSKSITNSSKIKS